MQTQVQRDYWPTIGWKQSPPLEQGVDPEKLSAVERYGETSNPNIHAILVVRHGYIVFEKYYHGYHKRDYQYIASMTKSITSALIGIALRDGYITCLDQKLAEFFPKYVASQEDPRKKEISIRDLLTMSSGFKWDEIEDESYLSQWLTSYDWIEFAFEQPMSHEPGQVFIYNSLGTHLLSVLLSKLTRMSILEFAREELFRPLGIPSNEKEGFFWEIDPQGYYTGGHGVKLTPRDMAKLGYLYLNDGRWGNRQIIPADYVKLSTQQQSEGGSPENANYGYLWWVTKQQGYSAFFAGGYGGQFIYVIPELDIVIVISSTLGEAPGNHHKYIVPRFVIQAIRDE